jgi:hypothetical protein
MARVLGHRQTKGAATDKPDLLPPRYIPTLPFHDDGRTGGSRANSGRPRSAWQARPCMQTVKFAFIRL